MEIEKNPAQLMGLMASFGISQTGDAASGKMMEAFKTLIGKEYEWKIGDVDGVLNRNFQFS